jgi:hypothetical protein
MSAERPHNEKSGVLFQNRRRSHPNAPAMTGEGTIDGQRYRIAAWEKRGKDGQAYWSLAFSVPQPAKPDQAPAKPGPLCTVCGKVPVPADQGFDTCPACVSRLKGGAQ